MIVHVPATNYRTPEQIQRHTPATLKPTMSLAEAGRIKAAWHEEIAQAFAKNGTVAVHELAPPAIGT